MFLVLEIKKWVFLFSNIQNKALSLVSFFGNKKMWFLILNIQNKAPSPFSCFGNIKMRFFISNLQNKALSLVSCFGNKKNGFFLFSNIQNKAPSLVSGFGNKKFVILFQIYKTRLRVLFLVLEKKNLYFYFKYTKQGSEPCFLFWK